MRALQVVSMVAQVLELKSFLDFGLYIYSKKGPVRRLDNYELVIRTFSGEDK